MFKWSLNESQFTFWDRLKIAGFIMNPSNFWTQNRQVAAFEKEMANFMGYRYAVFVSSGSTANTILAMHTKDSLGREFENGRNIVILPSVTWQTSCSPWIREGFKPYFIDVSLDNYGMDLDKLKEFLIKNHKKVAAVFPTSLLGFNINYTQLETLKQMFSNVKFYIDQCENNFGLFDKSNCVNNFKNFTCTLSTYFGHEIQSVEGGFLLTNTLSEYRNFILYRNHGMTRSLENTTFSTQINRSHLEDIRNEEVDPRFDFYLFGSNFRNTDINAFIGRIDLKKARKNVEKRKELYSIFYKNINRDRYFLPKGDALSNFVPFCIPIITKGETKEERDFTINIKLFAKEIESRPIISGFLGYQTPYRGLLDEKDHPNAVYLHKHGRYIGLHPKVNKNNLIEFVEFLNKI